MSEPSPRDTAIREAHREVRERHQQALGRPLTDAQVVGWQEAASVGVDAALSVIHDHVEAVNEREGFDVRQADYTLRRWVPLDAVLGVLGAEAPE